MRPSQDLLTYLPVLLVLLALNGWVVWRRYMSRRELVERVKELEDLSLAGRAIVEAQLDFDALCDFIVQQASKVIDTRTFHLGFFDGHFYRLRTWIIEGQRQEPRTFNLNEGPGLVGWVRETKKSLLIQDFEKEQDQLPTRPRYGGGVTPRSAIFIPLISQDTVIGVLAAQSGIPNHFTQKHVRQLTIFANQAAAAIANAWLYEQAQSRAAQIELIGTITHQINAADNLEDVFERIVTLTRETFGFFEVNIFGFNPASSHLVLVASSAKELPIGTVQFSRAEGLIGAAVASKTTIIANNAKEDPRFISQIGLPNVDELWTRIRSVLIVPLLVNKQVWGALEVLSDKLDTFRPQEQGIMEALASGIAIAIHKVQQLTRQRRQAWLTNARLQIAEAISVSVDLDGVLTSVPRLIPMLTTVTQCGVLLWDEELNEYQPGEIYGVDPAVSQAFAQNRLKLGQWRTLDVVHVGREVHTAETTLPWGKPAKQLWQLWPIPFERRLMGVLFVNITTTTTKPAAGETDPKQYQDELLKDVALQLGQAIERARLRHAQQEEAWVNTALLQVAQAANNLINLNEILDTIVRLVPMLVGVDCCILLTWDEDEQLFHLGPSYGISEMGRGVLSTLQLTFEELKSLIRTRYNMSKQNVEGEHYVVHVPRWLEQIIHTTQARAVPLRAQGRLLGSMLVGINPQDERFDGRRLNILLGIAHQAATAVLNHELYQEAAERDRLQRELDVAHKIQASLIPDGQPNIPHFAVASFWQAARQVSGDFYDFLQLRDGRWAIIIADVADKGVPAAIFMAVSRTILRTVAFNRTDPADILARTNELILTDSDSDLFVTVFLAIWDDQTNTLSYACGGHNPPLLFQANGPILPLQAKGVALGVLEDVTFESKNITLKPDDFLLLYTDGVTEAINEDYDEFGLERLYTLNRQMRGQEVSQIVDLIMQSIQDHAGNMAQFDDITMVAIKVCGLAPEAEKTAAVLPYTEL